MNKKRTFKKDFKKDYKPEPKREGKREGKRETKREYKSERPQSRDRPLTREYSRERPRENKPERLPVREPQRQSQRDSNYERKGTEIICGKNAVMELLRARKRKCYEVFVLEGEREQHVSKILELAQQLHVPVRTVDKDALAKLSRVEKNQGIAARADEFRYAEIDEIIAQLAQQRRPGFFLVLDGIMDPQNLGSLLRTSHQLGVDAVIVPKDNAAPVGPAARRASAGATEYLAIAAVTNISQTLEAFKEQGAWIYGAESSPEAKGLYQLDFTKEHVVLVMGGEGKGMRRLVREACDFSVEIPMSGKLDSLNVGVAGAVIIAEVQRQRRVHQSPEKIPQKP